MGLGAPGLTVPLLAQPSWDAQGGLLLTSEMHAAQGCGLSTASRLRLPHTRQPQCGIPRGESGRCGLPQALPWKTVTLLLLLLEPLPKAARLQGEASSLSLLVGDARGCRGRLP